MAWDDELTLILRYMINDVDSPTKYSDEALQKNILIAGMQVQQVATFSNVYACDVVNTTMTPDCTDGDTRDEAFINLVCLKAACTIVGFEMKLSSQQGGQGIKRIKDFGSEIEFQYDSSSTKAVQQTFCGGYKDALYAYLLDHTTEIGDIIIGPYRCHETYSYRE